MGNTAAAHNHEQYLKLNREFWKHKSFNDVSTDEYYTTCETFIRNIAQQYLTQSMKIIDLGCSDGRFTKILAEYCRTATGFEYSLPMLENAKTSPSPANVDFNYLDLESAVWRLPPSHAAFCMGVFTVIHKDDDVTKTLMRIKDSLNQGKGNLLITRESLSLHTTFRWFNPNQHYGIYRSYDEYQKLFHTIGFTHSKEIEIFSTEHTRNSFHIWMLESSAS